MPSPFRLWDHQDHWTLRFILYMFFYGHCAGLVVPFVDHPELNLKSFGHRIVNQGLMIILLRWICQLLLLVVPLHLR